jgi:hypothetical protein
MQSDIYAWLNLMPGKSPGKFHLTGEVTIKNTGSDEIIKMNLSKIIVNSGEELVYSFMPNFNPKFQTDDYNLKAGAEKEFSFGTESGLKIDYRLEKNSVITIKLKFTSDKGNYIHTVNNVEVERAY